MLDLILRKKRPARELSLRRRHGTGHKLTAKEQVLVEKSGKYLMYTILTMRKDPSNEKYKQLLKYCGLTISRYLMLSMFLWYLVP